MDKVKIAQGFVDAKQQEDTRIKKFILVDTDLPLIAKPNWDIYKNDHFALRKRCLDLFLKSINKEVIRARAGKRLEQLKHQIKSGGFQIDAVDGQKKLSAMARGEDVANFNFEFKIKEVENF